MPAGEGLADLLLDLGLQGAGGRREVDGQEDRAVDDAHVLDHVQVDEVAADLGVLDPLQGVEDVSLGQGLLAEHRGGSSEGDHGAVDVRRVTRACALLGLPPGRRSSQGSGSARRSAAQPSASALARASSSQRRTRSTTTGGGEVDGTIRVAPASRAASAKSGGVASSSTRTSDWRDARPRPRRASSAALGLPHGVDQHDGAGGFRRRPRQDPRSNGIRRAAPPSHRRGAAAGGSSGRVVRGR